MSSAHPIVFLDLVNILSNATIVLKIEVELSNISIDEYYKVFTFYCSRKWVTIYLQ
jgi:hypothetical protein